MTVNDGDSLWHLTFGRMGTSILKEPVCWTERRHVTGDRMLIVYRWQSSTNEFRAGVANSVPATHPPMCAEWVAGPEVVSDMRFGGLQ
jgi:hypothetical protein